MSLHPARFAQIRFVWTDRCPVCPMRAGWGEALPDQSDRETRSGACRLLLQWELSCCAASGAHVPHQEGVAQ